MDVVVAPGLRIGESLQCLAGLAWSFGEVPGIRLECCALYRLPESKLRLSHIKLAGFKSFVDPTHIALPGQLVGVVGPNGCGKSNVIDALRWVLGESRASALRGESMQDVIFNGSGNRKPVSRASVELVFDNSLGKVGGQWSSYAEISIKRVLQRDGDSNYYINNQNVRRKDITDIFLGTGVGARAYAIIEQGMISRIIEAKPEELRVFLEEAAGVSKYRDRRRETELRLGDTRDNLLRVSDILQELDKQLVHLGEQAEVAKTLPRTGSEARYYAAFAVAGEQAGSRSAPSTFRATGRKDQERTGSRDRQIARSGKQAGRQRAANTLRCPMRCMPNRANLYATNAEVARLEQQITFLIEQRNRLSQQIQNGERQIAQQQTQLQGLRTCSTHWQQQQQECRSARGGVREAAPKPRHNICRRLKSRARAAQERYNTMQREQLLIQQQTATGRDAARAHSGQRAATGQSPFAPDAGTRQSAATGYSKHWSRRSSNSPRCRLSMRQQQQQMAAIAGTLAAGRCGAPQRSVMLRRNWSDNWGRRKRA